MINIIKRLARWILRNEQNSEIQRLKQELQRYIDASDVIEEHIKKQENLMTDKTNKLSMLQTEYDNLKAKNAELESQNAILRQYYHLDEEPSQETLDKMYLDEKYREQEKELTILRARDDFRKAMITQLVMPVCYNQYPYWPYQWRLY